MLLISVFIFLGTAFGRMGRLFCLGPLRIIYVYCAGVVPQREGLGLGSASHELIGNYLVVSFLLAFCFLFFWRLLKCFRP